MLLNSPQKNEITASLSKFHHVIGHADKDGKIIFKAGYRLERFWYNLRMMLAFFICPEMRCKMQQDRFNLDYIHAIRREHAKDMRARDKAINRLQKKIRQLNHIIREWGLH